MKYCFLRPLRRANKLAAFVLHPLTTANVHSVGLLRVWYTRSRKLLLFTCHLETSSGGSNTLTGCSSQPVVANSTKTRSCGVSYQLLRQLLSKSSEARSQKTPQPGTEPESLWSWGSYCNLELQAAFVIVIEPVSLVGQNRNNAAAAGDQLWVLNVIFRCMFPVKSVYLAP